MLAEPYAEFPRGLQFCRMTAQFPPDSRECEIGRRELGRTSPLRTPRLTGRVLACARGLAVRTGYIGTVRHLFSLHLLLFFLCSSADLSFLHPPRVSSSANPPLHNAAMYVCMRVHAYTAARLSAYPHA